MFSCLIFKKLRKLPSLPCTGFIIIIIIIVIESASGITSFLPNVSWIVLKNEQQCIGLHNDMEKGVSTEEFNS